MNSINIRFEVSFGTGSEYDAEALQKIQQELATTVKRLQAQYTKNNSSRTSPPPKQQTDFFQFARAETENMTKASRFNTARNYRTAISRLHQYVSFTPLPFHSITPLFIDNFEKYLQNQGCNLNTISCYLRTLRAIYNKAVELELTPQQSPFIRAFTGYENTRKRGIPKLLIRKLISLDCSKRPTLQLAKDLFLFSIYVRGISFVDIAFLKKSHIYGNYLTYYRRKTHQQITVKLEPPSLEILNRYADTSQAGYLFPILRDTSPADNYREYRYQLGVYNKRLNKLSKLLGDQYHLSSYVSRHTWASLAKEQGISVSIISESLGHTSEKTTRIYMKALEKQKLDQANQKLINRMLVTRKSLNK